MTTRCTKCGERYDPEYRSHECTGTDLIDTMVGVGVAYAVDSLFNTLVSNEPSSSSSSSDSDFRGFDGGSFGGGGSSSDF